MSVLSLKQLIISELSMDDSPESLDLVDTQWNRFSTYTPEDLQYLLSKRAVARTLLSKSRKKVDTQIGFDQIKASQMPANLKKIIDDITEEIQEQYPEATGDNALVSTGSSATLYEGDLDAI